MKQFMEMLDHVDRAAYSECILVLDDVDCYLLGSLFLLFKFIYLWLS